jgi:hypothetical protein
VIQKRVIPMITVPARDRVFQAKIKTGIETREAGEDPGEVGRMI